MRDVALFGVQVVSTFTFPWVLLVVRISITFLIYWMCRELQFKMLVLFYLLLLLCFRIYKMDL